WPVTSGSRSTGRAPGWLPPPPPHPASVAGRSRSASLVVRPPHLFAMNVLFQPPPPMASAPDPRLVNRFGAAALLIDDAVRRRTADVAIPDGEALTALANFGHGRRIEELRAALSLSQPGGAHLVTRLER